MPASTFFVMSGTTAMLDAQSRSIVFLVYSWIGMISSFVFMVFSILSTSEVPYYLMMASILFWIGCGIAYIIRENRRIKNETLIEDERDRD